MTTENQPPAEEPNGDVDSIISDALGSVPAASPPTPTTDSTSTPQAAPDLGVPAPDATPEGSTPPAEIPPPPLSPDAVALADKQAQIDALTQANQEGASRLQQYEAQQRQNQLAQTTDRLSEYLVNDGLTPERAKQYANFLATAQAQGEATSRESAAKTEIARRFATQYGVPEDSLMTHTTPEAMEAAAKQEQRIMTLEQQLAETRQSQLPVQAFDNGIGVSASMTEAQKSAASGRGEYKYTPEEEAQRRTAALAKINR